MVLIGCGVRGFDTIILSERYPRTPAGRARFVREALSDKESILRRIGDWFREIYWKHLS
jgi:hypothetical protein